MVEVFWLFILITAVIALARTYDVERECDRRIDKVVREFYRLEDKFNGKGERAKRIVEEREMEVKNDG